MSIAPSLYTTESRQFNLARPRLLFELVGLALSSAEVAIYYVTDLTTDFLLVALPVNVLLLVGGYMVWRPMNYLFVGPDTVVIRSWSFSGRLFGNNTGRREIFYDEVHDLGADSGTGTLRLQFDPSRLKAEGSPDADGEITLRIAPAKQAVVAQELISERRDRVRPFLAELDSRLEAARDEGGRLLAHPSPPPPPFLSGEGDAISERRRDSV